LVVLALNVRKAGGYEIPGCPHIKCKEGRGLWDPPLDSISFDEILDSFHVCSIHFALFQKGMIFADSIFSRFSDLGHV
jgi:hypothetical protein